MGGILRLGCQADPQHPVSQQCPMCLSQKQGVRSQQQGSSSWRGRGLVHSVHSTALVHPQLAQNPNTPEPPAWQSAAGAAALAPAPSSPLPRIARATAAAALSVVLALPGVGLGLVQPVAATGTLPPCSGLAVVPPAQGQGLRCREGWSTAVVTKQGHRLGGPATAVQAWGHSDPLSHCMQ